ncbi:hypothetical protein CWC46_07160 [Prodigiosinella confusarubida]|uniref:Uncharacterized protein n=1 Tax=Serratia sp. (strain ATCC 39006) TaxID=104623 RepID=A0A2I5T4X4_SERS3|nr:hypothetical protein CWC46_07160 [Serratia sp. ATCC 39006]AUH03938.1 hypothetical protein Ser39006_007165 [Serratia sp. ATCC 39006]
MPTPVTYWHKFQGIHSVIAFLYVEIYWVSPLFLFALGSSLSDVDDVPIPSSDRSSCGAG